MSWAAFRSWLKWLPATSAVSRLRQDRAATEAIPQEQRTVGSGAIPLDEMDDYLAQHFG